MPVDVQVWDEAPDLLALAMVLTGRPDPAADLVGEVVAVAGPPRSIDTGPTGLRNLVVGRYLRRPRPLPDPTAEWDLPDELARVAGGLDRLDPLSRATVVLRYRERITLAETAAILDRSPVTVERHLRDAVTALDADPTEIVATLDALAWGAPTVDAVRPAARRHEHLSRRRRRRIRLLGGVLGVGLAVAILVPSVVLPRLPVYVRPSGEWSLTFEVDPPSGWQIRGRYVERDTDTLLLSPALLAEGEGACFVVAETLTGPTPLPPLLAETTVRGRPGGFTNTAGDAAALSLVWDYAPGGRAAVSCDERVGGSDLKRRLSELARDVHFRRVPLRLPFAVSAVPPGYEIQFAGQDGSASRVALGHVGSGDLTLGLEVPAEAPGGSPESVVIAGEPAQAYAGENSLTICTEVQEQLACLSADSFSGARQSTESMTRDLTAMTTGLRFASDLADEATWFDGVEALPR